MGYKDPEKRKAYLKKWKENNKDKIKSYEPKQKETRQKWLKSENGIKSRTFSNWKRLGLKDNLEDVYKIYQETHKCIICDNNFKNSKDKHMNHCHETGYFLNVICQKCNMLEHNDTYFKLQKPSSSS
jgi:hypothetical protein